MYARVNTFTGVTDVDAVVNFLQESLSVVHAQRGYKGMVGSVDRANGVMGLLTLWETEADREASNSALSKTRQEAQSQFATGLTVETLEEQVVKISAPPAVGCRLMVTRVSMDPAKVGELQKHFETNIVPQIAAAPGFRSLRSMLDPQTGEGIVGAVWDDEQSMQNASREAMARRPDAQSRGVVFGETSYREIVFVDMP